MPEIETPKHYEMHAGAIVHNTYLRITIVILALTLIYVVRVNREITVRAAQVKVPIVMFDKFGRSIVMNYGGAGYQPTTEQIRAALYTWAMDFYGRDRFTLADNYADALRFEHEDLQKQDMEAEKQTRWIEAFVNGKDPEVKVEVRNVTFPGQLGKSLNAARVEFDKVTFGAANVETNRESVETDLVFEIGKEPVADPVNPLSLKIRQRSEYPAFKN